MKIQIKIPFKHLEKIRKLKRHRAHPIIYKVHKKHKISKKTLFYIKEYGPHTNVPYTIIKESIKILLLASLISSFGGFAIENIKYLLITITPLIIIMPVINDMIGDYGTIISSQISTMLHEGLLKTKWYKNKMLKKLFIQIITIATLTSIISAISGIILSYFGNLPPIIFFFKIVLITLINVILLITIIFIIAVIVGIYLYKKREDPNNYLIPLTTSVADFSNMILLSILIRIFF